jgi:hypothetical protein
MNRQYKENTLLLFHGNSDCANTLQCCVLHTLRVLLVHIRIEKNASGMKFKDGLHIQGVYMYISFVIQHFEMMFKIFRYILQELGHGDKVKNVSTL